MLLTRKDYGILSKGDDKNRIHQVGMNEKKMENDYLTLNRLGGTANCLFSFHITFTFPAPASLLMNISFFPLQSAVIVFHNGISEWQSPPFSFSVFSLYIHTLHNTYKYCAHTELFLCRSLLPPRPLLD